MKFALLSILAASLVPFAAIAQNSEANYNLRTNAFLHDGAPSLGDSDKVRWDFFKADANGTRTSENVGGAYDATFETNLPAGRYVAVAALGNIQRQIPFSISANKVTEISASFDAGILTVNARRSAGSSIAEPMARIEARADNFSDNFYGSKTLFVPAGEVTLIGTLGPARSEDKITIKAGEKFERDLVIPSGVVFAKAVYSEGGMDITSDDVQFQVVKAEQTLDGSHESVSSIFGVNRPMQLPEGKFIMRAKLGQVTAEAPFEIVAGERADVTINLNAGVLAVNAPQADRIDFDTVSNDIQKRKHSVSARYGTEHQDTLSPGQYTVTISYPAKLKVQTKTIETEVKASERTELNVGINDHVEPEAQN